MGKKREKKNVTPPPAGAEVLKDKLYKFLGASRAEEDAEMVDGAPATPTRKPKTKSSRPTVPPVSLRKLNLDSAEEVQDVPMRDDGESTQNADSDILASSPVSKRAAEKLLKKEKRLAAAMSRDSGLPPTTKCPVCEGDHWRKDCPVDKQNKKEKDKLRKRKRGEEAAEARKRIRSQGDALSTTSAGSRPSTPGALPKDFSARLTKRAKKGNPGEGPQAAVYSDGTYLCLRVPEKATNVTASNIALMLQADLADGARATKLGPLSGPTWYIGFGSVADAGERVDKEVSFGSAFGLSQPIKVPLTPYVSAGPQVFLCDRIGPVDDDEAQRLVAKHVVKEEFWYGRQTIMSIEGPARILVFKEPAKFLSFEVRSKCGFALRFRAIERKAACPLCGMGHSVVSCGQVQPAPLPEGLTVRLAAIPL